MGFEVREMKPREEPPFREVLTSDAAVYFWKGRVALYALLKAFGIGAGDEVIVPAFTCVVVPEAVLFAGATPVYVDITRESLTLDPRQVEAAISRRTKAVIVQHTFGFAADVDAIRRTTVRRGIRIIEDCAHTMSTRYHGAAVGTLGDGAFFSSQWTKPVTTGLGGIALARDPELRARLKQFASEFYAPTRREVATLGLQLAMHRALFRPALYWASRDLLHLLARAGLFLGSSTEDELNGCKPARYEMTMSAFQERKLKKQLSALDAYALHRTWVQDRYGAKLPRLGFRSFATLPDTQPVMLRYPVVVANKAEVLRKARRQHVEVGDWFLSPVHPVTEPGAMQKVGYRPGSCPNAEWASHCIVNLPTHNRVTASTIAKTCAFMASYAIPEASNTAEIKVPAPVTNVA